jgi:Na+-driven multidrug efflux pump
VLYCNLCLAICLGAARGCGWQNLCAFINLGAYYVVGIPSVLLFAFVFHFGGTVGFSLSLSLSLSLSHIAIAIQAVKMVLSRGFGWESYVDFLFK